MPPLFLEKGQNEEQEDMCLCPDARQEEYPLPKWICFYFSLKAGKPPVHPLNFQSTSVIKVSSLRDSNVLISFW
jgi:hypothetical protein